MSEWDGHKRRESCCVCVIGKGKATVATTLHGGWRWGRSRSRLKEVMKRQNRKKKINVTAAADDETATAAVVVDGAESSRSRSSGSGSETSSWILRSHQLRVVRERGRHKQRVPRLEKRVAAGLWMCVCVCAKKTDRWQAETETRQIKWYCGKDNVCALLCNYSIWIQKQQQQLCTVIAGTVTHTNTHILCTFDDKWIPLHADVVHLSERVNQWRCTHSLHKVRNVNTEAVKKKSNSSSNHVNGHTAGARCKPNYMRQRRRRQRRRRIWWACVFAGSTFAQTGVCICMRICACVCECEATLQRARNQYIHNMYAACEKVFEHCKINAGHTTDDTPLTKDTTTTLQMSKEAADTKKWKYKWRTRLGE